MVSELRFKSSAAGFTPVVIRGESSNLGTFRGNLLIDTLSFTLSFQDICRFLDFPVVSLKPSPSLRAIFTDLAFSLFGFVLEEDFKGGKNYFANSINLSGGAGFLCFGGNNVSTLPDGTVRVRDERVQVYLSGAGCERIRDFAALYEPLKAMGAEKLSRCDIALDDFDGVFDIEHAMKLYADGQFTGNGRPPTAKLIDDMGSGEGKTFYVGKREYGKMIRIYEKGRQLGDKLSPWVRWEVELGSKHRIIPLDALLDPVGFFLGAYPKALSFVEGLARMISTSREKAVITYKRLRQIMVSQYGKLLNFSTQILGFTPEQVFSEFVSTRGVPASLSWMCHMRPEDIPDYELLTSNTRS